MVVLRRSLESHRRTEGLRIREQLVSFLRTSALLFHWKRRARGVASRLKEAPHNESAQALEFCGGWTARVLKVSK